MWDGLHADWQPQTHTERYYLERIATSQWLLARKARSETRICDADLALRRGLELLDRVAAQRTRLERSFTTVQHELQQLQKERQARPQPQSAQAAETAKAATAPVHEPTEHNPSP